MTYHKHTTTNTTWYSSTWYNNAIVPFMENTPTCPPPRAHLSASAIVPLPPVRLRVRTSAAARKDAAAAAAAAAAATFPPLEIRIRACRVSGFRTRRVYTIFSAQLVESKTQTPQGRGFAFPTDTGPICFVPPTTKDSPSPRSSSLWAATRTSSSTRRWSSRPGSNPHRPPENEAPWPDIMVATRKDNTRFA